jgi:ABC-type Zn uptake system ZnuABC Zn-binding protein ZnuA
MVLALVVSGGALAMNVVTTTTDLASIAREVGGDAVTVNSLQDGARDPHFLEAKPSYIMRARRADLWIRVGMELEIGYEPVIIDSARNPRIRPGMPGHLDASEGILRLEVPTTKVDRSMGDVHPLGNPHYWLDPWNGRAVARSVRDSLTRLDPARGAEYDARCRAFERRLDEAMFGAELVAALGGDVLWRAELSSRLDEELEGKGLAGKLGGWLGAMRPHRGSKIITYHRSWVYFTNRFGLEVVAELEPKPGIPPSPGHLAEVIERARSAGAALLLMEPFYERKGPEFVASRTGIRVVEAANSVGGQPEATDYVAMLDNVVQKAKAVLASDAR